MKVYMPHTHFIASSPLIATLCMDLNNLGCEGCFILPISYCVHIDIVFIHNEGRPTSIKSLRRW